MQKTTLGKNKEILDTEILGISERVKVAKQKCIKIQQTLDISLFYNLQIAINKLKVIDNKEG